MQVRAVPGTAAPSLPRRGVLLPGKESTSRISYSVPKVGPAVSSARQPQVTPPAEQTPGLYFSGPANP